MPDIRQLEEENRRLRRSVEELSLLADIAAATSDEVSLEAAIESITQKCVRSLRAEQGAVYLLTESKESRFETLWRESPSSGVLPPVRLSDQVIGWMIRNERPLVVNDPANAPFPGLPESDPPIRSLLAAPLRFQTRLMGLIALLNKKHPAGFTEDDRRLLGIVAAHAAPLLRNAQLIAELKQDKDRLAEENSRLWRDVKARFSPEGVIGSSAPIQEILGVIDRVRDVDVDVLITGESGTGKELYARTIHLSGKRGRRPFVALNCAALPENLLEAELFGIEKGVATGVDKRAGLFETAHQGTLFLDEIGDLPLTAQAKILRVLQERVVQRLGGRETIRADVRVIAATNKDLEAEIEAGRFREDLFYRLNVIRLRTPALREIPEDIEDLANFFLAEARKTAGRADLEFSTAAIACLESYAWPGNIRQLQNEVKRAAIYASGPVIERRDLSPDVQGAAAAASRSPSERTFDDALADYERRLLEDALRANGGNQAQTARKLGISRQGLIKKMKRLGVAANA